MMTAVTSHMFLPELGPVSRKSRKLGDATFKASNGWLDRFKKRYNITSKVISGEAGGISEETAASLEREPTEYFEWLLPRECLRIVLSCPCLSSTTKKITC